MKTQFYIFLLIIIILSLFCKNNDNPHNNVQKIEPYVVKNADFVFTFSNEKEKLNYLFKVNNRKESYQIELMKEPKDFINITINMNQGIIDTLYVTRFQGFNDKISSVMRKKNHFIGYVMVSYLDNYPLYNYYKKIEKIKISKPLNTITNYLRNEIWVVKDSIEIYHGQESEWWALRGKKDGKEILVSRKSFKDSTFYSNIQKIIDICKIKDYKYIKR